MSVTGRHTNEPFSDRCICQKWIDAVLQLPIKAALFFIINYKLLGDDPNRWMS